MYINVRYNKIFNKLHEEIKNNFISVQLARTETNFVNTSRMNCVAYLESLILIAQKFMNSINYFKHYIKKIIYLSLVKTNDSWIDEVLVRNFVHSVWNYSDGKQQEIASNATQEVANI